jgi:hypothetical protein
MFTSSIAEPSAGETLWVQANQYAYPTKVYRQQTHKIYQSLSTILTQDNTAPELSIFADSPKWVEISSTNKFAMFDMLRNGGSSATNSISIVVTPNQRIDAISIIGMENVSNILITANYGVGSASNVQIENKANSYTSNGVTKYYSNYIKVDIAPYYNIEVTITLTGTGTIKSGNVVFGIYEPLGFSQRGIAVDAINFSTVDRDLYGNAALVQRRNVPKITLQTLIDRGRVNRAAQVREYLNAKPAVWSGLDQKVSEDYYDSLLIMGFYKTFTIDISNPFMATINLDLEEI